MALKIGGRQQAALVATGDQDYEPNVHGEVDLLFDADVAGALVFGTNATANGSASGARLSFGAMDAAGGEGAISVSGEDAVTTSNWTSRGNNTKVVQFRDYAGTATVAEADGTDISTGIRLAWTTVDASVARRMSALIFGGASVECQAVVGSFTSAGAAENVTVNHTLSGAPDAIIALGVSGAINTNQGQGLHSLGFMARSAGTYACLTGTRTDNSATEQAAETLLTDCIAAQQSINSTATAYKVTLGTFGASSFVMSSSANAGSDAVLFLLLKAPNLAVATGTVDLPNNTNAFTVHTGLAKKPKCILTLTSMLTAIDTGNIGDPAGWFGFGAAFLNNGFIEQLCCGCSTDDAATGTNALTNKSMTHARWVETLDATGAVALAGDITAFTADGATGQLTTAPGAAVKAGYLIFGDEDATPQVTSVTPQPMVEGSAVTISGSSFAASGNSVEWGTETLAITAEDADEITATAAIGDQTYGDALDLLVNNGTADSNTTSISMEPASGERYYNLSGGVNSDTAIRFTSVPDLADNAQIHVTEVRDPSATPIDLALFEILPDGTPQLDNSVTINPGEEVEIDCRANNRDGEGWGASETVTLTVSLGTSPMHRGVMGTLGGIMVR